MTGFIIRASMYFALGVKGVGFSRVHVFWPSGLTSQLSGDRPLAPRGMCQPGGGSCGLLWHPWRSTRAAAHWGQRLAA